MRVEKEPAETRCGAFFSGESRAGRAWCPALAGPADTIIERANLLAKSLIGTNERCDRNSRLDLVRRQHPHSRSPSRQLDASFHHASGDGAIRRRSYDDGAAMCDRERCGRASTYGLPGDVQRYRVTFWKYGGRSFLVSLRISTMAWRSASDSAARYRGSCASPDNTSHRRL
jgi:hypothetical protein